LKADVGRLAPRAGRVAVHAGGLSWPSGHTANTVVSGALVLWLLPQLGLPTRLRRGRVAAGMYLVAVAGSGLALVLLRYHWTSDVAGGWLLGAVVLAAVALLTPTAPPPSSYHPGEFVSPVTQVQSTHPRGRQDRLQTGRLPSCWLPRRRPGAGY